MPGIPKNESTHGLKLNEKKCFLGFVGVFFGAIVSNNVDMWRVCWTYGVYVYVKSVESVFYSLYVHSV